MNRFTIHEIIELSKIREDMVNKGNEEGFSTINEDTYPHLYARLEAAEDKVEAMNQIINALDPSGEYIQGFNIPNEKAEELEDEDLEFTEDTIQKIVDAIREVAEETPQEEDHEEHEPKRSELSKVLGHAFENINARIQSIDKEDVKNKANELVNKTKDGAKKATQKASDITDAVRAKIEEMNSVDGMDEHEITSEYDLINEIRNTLDYAFELLEELEAKVDQEEEVFDYDEALTEEDLEVLASTEKFTISAGDLNFIIGYLKEHDEVDLTELLLEAYALGLEFAVNTAMDGEFTELLVRALNGDIPFVVDGDIDDLKLK